MSYKGFLIICCILLFASVFLLASCSAENDTVITPESYPPIDAGGLPPVLQEFLARYDTFDALNDRIQEDYKFIAREVNNRPAGSRDSSPLVALSEGISDCYETAVISALFGEKLGYKPYMLILEHRLFSERQPHSIHVFQDVQTGKWGYNDYLLELLQPSFYSVSDLAEYYIASHPVDARYYRRWYLADLTLIEEEYQLDWRTTTRSIRIRDKIIVEEGRYRP